MGFFTDTTVCIGCKACEVACKQWNDLPADGYDFGKGRSLDHTGSLSASTWRHVHFVEIAPPREQEREAARARARRAAPAASCQTSRPRARHAAVRSDEDVDLRRAGRRRRAARGGHGPLAVRLRRLQALHERRLPGRLPDRRADPHRVRDGDRAARHLQRLRLLRHRVPVRRHRPRSRTTGAPRSARSATTACRTAWSRPARRRARPTRSSSAPTTSSSSARRGASLELHERGLETAYLYGAGDEGADQLAGGLGAFFLLTEPPERFGLPAQADSPIQANMPVATAAGLAAGVTRGGRRRRLAARRPPEGAAMSHGHGPPPEQRIRERGQRVIDGRDVTPAVGRARRAGPLAPRASRARACAASSRASRTAAGRSCTAATRATPRPPARRRGARRPPGACAAAPTCPCR